MSGARQQDILPRPSIAVTGLGWCFILLSLTTLLLLILPLPGTTLTAVLNTGPGSGGLTGGAAWLAERSAHGVAVLMLGALVTLFLSVALLRRRPWARRAFIALMAVGFVSILGGVALIQLTFGLLPGVAVAEAAVIEESMTGLIALLAGLTLAGTVFSVLFAWAGWRLTTPVVRAEFERARPGYPGRSQ